jgi:hypothetical protein
MLNVFIAWKSNNKAKEMHKNSTKNVESRFKKIRKLKLYISMFNVNSKNIVLEKIYES